MEARERVVEAGDGILTDLQEGRRRFLALVDEILRTAAENPALGSAFYAELEQRLNALAERRAFDSLRQERNK